MAENEPLQAVGAFNYRGYHLQAGKVAFELSAAQLHESAGALKELEKAGMSLTEAIQFAIRHAKPPAGILSVAQAIAEALAEKSKSKRPTYLADLRKR